MLRKRLIGVVTVKDGWAVQSMGYGRYLPLGHPEYLVENLDRWGADEILVMSIDRSVHKLGPDLSLLKRLSAMGLSTPLTYGGGIHKAEEAVAVIQSGAERICLDAVLHDDPQQAYKMAALIGAQALVGSLPLSVEAQGLCWYDYRSKTTTLLDSKHLTLFADGLISEALIIDWHHEGQQNSFNSHLISLFPHKEIPLIAFGGLSDANQLKDVLAYPQVVAAGVGNFLNYSEHAFQSLKKNLTSSVLRPAKYVGSFS